MSHEKATEDLNTSVGELNNMMNNTFTCCVRNYEALRPYREKKETTPKIRHKLLHIYNLLNKLNEELLGLREEYETGLLNEEKGETILSERDRKRKTTETLELGRHKTKCIKREMPFSSNTKYSFTVSSETGMNIQSDNILSLDTEETKHALVEKCDVPCVKNIKSKIQDSTEVEDGLTVGNGDITVSERSCDTINNEVTVCVAGNGEHASVADRLVGCNKPADTISERENNDCVPWQNLLSQDSSQDNCDDSASVLSKNHDIYRGHVDCTTSFCSQGERPFNSKESVPAFTTCDKESPLLAEGRANICYMGERTTPPSPIRYDIDDEPVPRSKELCSDGDKLYGIAKCTDGRFECTLCDRVFVDYQAVKGHVKGKRHKNKRITAEKISCIKDAEVQSSYLLADTIPSSSCDSTASDSVGSDIFCSLADTVAVVEDKHQVILMKHAVQLDDIWTYFHAPFHINKKFFRIQSGKVVCSLCNEKVGRYISDVKKHLSRLSHLDRMNVFRKIELTNMSSNKRLLNIPGILNNIIPRSQFSLRNNGFFCSVCKCVCENHVVLKHMTGASHIKNLDEMKTSV